jgi:hypothetical protein
MRRLVRHVGSRQSVVSPWRLLHSTSLLLTSISLPRGTSQRTQTAPSLPPSNPPAALVELCERTLQDSQRKGKGGQYEALQRFIRDLTAVAIDAARPRDEMNISPGSLVVALQLAVAACETLRVSSLDPRCAAALADLMDVLSPQLTSHTDRREVFIAASRLRIGRSETVQELMSQCLIKSCVTSCDTPGDLVSLLSAIAHTHQRLRLKSPPNVTPVIWRLRTHFKLTNFQALDVVTSLSRLKIDQSASDTVTVYTKLMTGAVSAMNTRQLIDCVYVTACGVGVDHEFAVEALRTIAGHVERRKTKDLAQLCRCIALLWRDTRAAKAHLRDDCTIAVQRLTPLLSSRVEALIGQFTRAQAHDVLTCFRALNVKGGVVFSQLCAT